MSTSLALTTEPTQLTNGSNGAHVTVERGAVLYADSANSAAWHYLNGCVMQVLPPVSMWVKARAPGGATLVVTTWTE